MSSLFSEDTSLRSAGSEPESFKLSDPVARLEASGLQKILISTHFQTIPRGEQRGDCRQTQNTEPSEISSIDELADSPVDRYQDMVDDDGAPQEMLLGWLERVRMRTQMLNNTVREPEKVVIAEEQQMEDITKEDSKMILHEIRQQHESAVVSYRETSTIHAHNNLRRNLDTRCEDHIEMLEKAKQQYGSSPALLYLIADTKYLQALCYLSNGQSMQSERTGDSSTGFFSASLGKLAKIRDILNEIKDSPLSSSNTRLIAEQERYQTTIDFRRVLARMHTSIDRDIERAEQELGPGRERPISLLEEIMMRGPPSYERSRSRCLPSS